MRVNLTHIASSYPKIVRRKTLVKRILGGGESEIWCEKSDVRCVVGLIRRISTLCWPFLLLLGHLPLFPMCNASHRTWYWQGLSATMDSLQGEKHT